MSESLTNWQPCPRPERKALIGRYVRLEPLSAERHGDGLYAVSSLPDAAMRFVWLPDHPPESREALQPWLDKAEASDDPLYFAVIDQTSDQVVGRQSFLGITPAHGTIEIGHIYWGPAMARRPAATEAQFLFMRYAFELGYRRYEWRCNNRNEPSKRAAERFGFKFETLFRQSMVIKGQNRDTAWHSIIDREWPALHRAYEAWLDPVNFDGNGRQKRKLDEFRAEFGLD